MKKRLRRRKFRWMDLLKRYVFLAFPLAALIVAICCIIAFVSKQPLADLFATYTIHLVPLFLICTCKEIFNICRFVTLLVLLEQTYLI